MHMERIGEVAEVLHLLVKIEADNKNAIVVDLFACRRDREKLSATVHIEKGLKDTGRVRNNARKPFAPSPTDRRRSHNAAVLDELTVSTQPACSHNQVSHLLPPFLSLSFPSFHPLSRSQFFLHRQPKQKQIKTVEWN